MVTHLAKLSCLPKRFRTKCGSFAFFTVSMLASLMILLCPLISTDLMAQGFDLAPWGGGTTVPDYNQDKNPDLPPTTQQPSSLYPGLSGFGSQGSDNLNIPAQPLQGLNLSNTVLTSPYAEEESRFNIFFDAHALSLNDEAFAIITVIADEARELQASKIVIIANPDGFDPTAPTMGAVWAEQIKKALLNEGLPPGLPITIRQQTGFDIKMQDADQSGLLAQRKRVEVAVMKGYNALPLSERWQ